MKQMTFADAEYAGKRKQTRKELFLIEMDRVVPWKGLIALIEPHYPKGEGGRPAYPLMAMLRVHLLQNWFGYSDPAMEEALYETTILRQFAGLNLERIPDETTILNFRRLLEKHELAAGILAVINGYLGDRGLSLRQGTNVDATLINAPSSTKNKDGKRDPEMHQTKKGNQYYFGMKAHIGADDESGLVHSVVGTAANVADVTQVDKLVSKTPSVQDDGFLDAMKQALSTTSKLQADSGRLSREFTLENPTVGLEETILAGVKSNIAFQATLHSRNRIVQAYTDVMNMQV